MNIVKRVTIAGKSGQRFCEAVWSGNNKLKPNAVIVDGREEIHPEGTYYLDCTLDNKRKREPAGKTASEAQSYYERRKKELEIGKLSEELGLPAPATSQDGPTLKNAVSAFLKATERDKKHSTYKVYKTGLGFFLESCKKASLQDISRDDLLNFRAFLISQKSHTPRTANNYLNNIVSFLNAQGVPRLLKKGDRKKSKQNPVEIYERGELEKFFAVCDGYEKLLFEFFLWTGMREQEVIYLTWANVDFRNNTVSVRPNKEFGWTPKTEEERTIPVPQALLDKLQLLKKEANAKHSLVFPTESGNPKYDYLDICKSVARRAGLNCGHCESCRERNRCENWFLHKFRATFCTWALWGYIWDTDEVDPRYATDIETVRDWMGHTDTEAIKRYLLPLPSKRKEVTNRVNGRFGNGVAREAAMAGKKGA